MGNCILVTVPYGLAEVEEDNEESVPQQRNIYFDWMNLVFRGKVNTSPRRRMPAPDG